MTKQKKGFWTFIFSFIPGAGEMHMGFMKQGISIMVVFWMCIGLASFLNMGPLLYGLPLLWFYSFFNVHNLRSLTEEEFYSIEDEYAFRLDEVISNKRDFVKKHRYIIAIGLILVGCSILWDNSYRLLADILPNYFSDIIYRIGDMVPQLVWGFVIIGIGVSMVRGKKKELEDNEGA
ncbi:MAG: hypothetical protein ACERKZ_00400 [Lachnotalea sp.]